MNNGLAYSVLMPLAPWEPPEQVAMALASLESQTLPPSQVVVSCDGDPPEALNNVLSASLLPVEVILGPGGEGVGPVLARGLERCSKELVVRADADDLSHPARCERQVTILNQYPELAVLGSCISEFIIKPELPVSVRHVPLRPLEVRNVSQWRNPMNHPSVAFRRTTIQKVGGYRNVPAFEDYELWLRLLSHGYDLANLPDILVFAKVGRAHLQRRHGLRYALKEWRFLCVCKKYYSSGHVLLMALTRLPLRILPSQFLAYTSSILLRRIYPIT